MLLLSCKRQQREYELQELESVKLIGQNLKVNLADTIFKDKDLESYALAVLPNSCDQGYGIFTIDENSVYFFEKYLGDLFN